MGANISASGRATVDPHSTDAPQANDAATAMGVFMSEGLDDLKSYPIGLNSSMASSYAQSEFRHDGLSTLSYTSLATLSMRATITANSIHEEGGQQGPYVATSRQLSPRRSPGLLSYSPSSSPRLARQLSQGLNSPVSSSLPELTFSSSPRSDAPPVFMLSHQLESAPTTPAETPRATADCSSELTNFSPSPRGMARAVSGSELLDMSVVRSSISLTIPRGVVRSSISLTIPRPKQAEQPSFEALAVAHPSLLLVSPWPSSAAPGPPLAELTGGQANVGHIVNAAEGDSEAQVGVACAQELYSTDVADAHGDGLLVHEVVVEALACQEQPDEAPHAVQDAGDSDDAQSMQPAFEFIPSPRTPSGTNPSCDVTEHIMAEHAPSAAAPVCEATPFSDAITTPQANVAVPYDANHPEVATPPVGFEVSPMSEGPAPSLLPQLHLTSRQPDESAFDFVAASPHAHHVPASECALGEEDAQSDSPLSSSPVSPALAEREPSPAVQQPLQHQSAEEEETPETDDAPARAEPPAVEAFSTTASLSELGLPLSQVVDDDLSTAPGQATTEQRQEEEAAMAEAAVECAGAVSLEEPHPLPTCDDGVAEEPHQAFELSTLDWTAAVQGEADSEPTMISMGQARDNPPAHPLQASEQEWMSESEHEGPELFTEPVIGQNSRGTVQTTVLVVAPTEDKLAAQHSEDVATTRSEDQTVNHSAEEAVGCAAEKAALHDGGSVEVATCPVKRRSNPFLCCFFGRVGDD